MTLKLTDSVVRDDLQLLHLPKLFAYYINYRGTEIVIQAWNIF